MIVHKYKQIFVMSSYAVHEGASGVAVYKAPRRALFVAIRGVGSVRRIGSDAVAAGVGASAGHIFWRVCRERGQP